MLVNRIPQTVRVAVLFHGHILPMDDAGQIVLPTEKFSWADISVCHILKEDPDGNPLWWMDHGTQWIQFGAKDSDEATELYGTLVGETLTVNDPLRKMIHREEDGTAKFQLHI